MNFVANYMQLTLSYISYICSIFLRHHGVRFLIVLQIYFSSLKCVELSC